MSSTMIYVYIGIAVTVVVLLALLYWFVIRKWLSPSKSVSTVRSDGVNLNDRQAVED